MSCYYQNDLVSSTNNTINDNKSNAKKVARSPLYQIKKLIKCFVKTSLQVKQQKKNSYVKNAQPTYFVDDEEAIQDNIANEILENEIFEEIDCCEQLAAVQIYNGDSMEILPITRGQRYVPVHFARTEAGTFFWTSMTAPDCDIVNNGDLNAICCGQTPELQVPSDRWAQA
ncbi:hypothetical protein ABEB36_009782 [Hypothenemus hampei]|uniref:Enhancer of split malpha protein n=1 Tax=Hypothenemus hampei TaxID=57062 RepID=A0ABD1EHH0_HYPHA